MLPSVPVLGCPVSVVAPASPSPSTFVVVEAAALSMGCPDTGISTRFPSVSDRTFPSCIAPVTSAC